jgi:hypothetical protein
VTHLLAKDGRIHSGKLPLAITAMTEGVHPTLLKPKSFDRRVQTIMQDIGFAQRRTIS